MDTSSTEPVAEWQAPRWADSSQHVAGGIWYCLAADRALWVLDDEGQPRPLVPQVTQLDTIEVESPGRVTVTRRSEPHIALDGLQMTLDQASALGTALPLLVAQLRRPG